MSKKGSRRLAALLMAILCTVMAGCDALTPEQLNAVSQLLKDSDININLNVTDGSEDTETTDTEEIPEQIEYSCATKEEGIEYLMSNKEYYDGFMENELEFKMDKKNASMDEYLEYAKEQVLDFTDEEKAKIDELMAYVEDVLAENGYTLPDLDPIVFISTTQDEESGSGAYTHGTQIYFNMKLLTEPGYEEWAKTTMVHEIFHCITRSNPEFRRDMYKLIHFTVQEDDFAIPPSVEEYFISNPDVEHHNSYATFTIGGEKIDCFAALVSTKHYENKGDSFFSCMTTALVPIDGSDVYYTPEDASDFYEVFGENTGYVIDPEECMADNFSFAVVYGAEGPEGKGYRTPEIIDGIIDYLKQDKENTEDSREIDTSVMTPWINSMIKGVVTDDVNADIKDDFYLNVNHDYLRDAQFRPGYPVDMPVLEAEDTVKERCFEILNDKSLKGRDAQLVQDYYELFLDWEGRNKAGVEPLKPFVTELDKVKTIDEMTQFLLSDTNFTNGRMLSMINIEPSSDDSSKYEVEIYPASLALGDPAEYRELTENGKRQKKAFEEECSYMLGRFGYSDSETEDFISDMFDFEEKIAEHMMTEYEMSASDALEKRINPVTMADIKEMSGDYPLASYMEKWGYAESKLINMKEPEWLNGLKDLYNEDNLDGIKSYVLLSTMSGAIARLDEEAFRKSQEIDNEMQGITESSPDEEIAYSDTRSKFPNSFARIYVDKYLNEEIRQEIRQLCQDAIDTYYEMFDIVDWLSDETREQAKYKLKHITINSVYPDKWRDDSMFHVTSKEDGGTYYDAINDYRMADHELALTMINGTVDREIWDLNILDTNAFYNPQDNSINIIPGFFCDATYRSDMSVEEKYGALGSVIGHEISHAFDTNGAQYDADGNFNNWWTDEDFAAFRKRADKLIAYYDKVVAFDDGTPYRGQMVQTEAIADMAGLKCMLKMAEKVDGFDYDKFFRAHAYLWGEVGTLSLLERLALTDCHPLHYLRCNVSVQQYDEFLETYDIEEGDGMYLAPEDRIAVW